ncbi:hypothetical protein P692DRAFT_20919879 [Suillus brevipes Sb2]|nr:hypothetical protein P692DRAFT_20919879 [Suillus brevipes Sb2]
MRYCDCDMGVGGASEVAGGVYHELHFPTPLAISAPIFWTNKNKNILAAFSFTEVDYAKTIYEFDASTLETVETPFEGHTEAVCGLALSFDDALLASASRDDTVKLWAFESRQLLATFDVQNLGVLILSPDSRKLAYATYTIVPPSNPDLVQVHPTWADHRICICDTPPDILAQARVRNLGNIHFPCANLFPYRPLRAKSESKVIY